MYTESEEKFLIDNYPIYGGKYCAIKLNRSINAVGAKAKRLSLVAGRKRHPSLQKVSIEQFANITTKETAYFLGFFWADGYIHHYKCKTSNHWRIVLEIVKKDAECIKPILDKLGTWVIIKRKRRKSWQETWQYVTHNKDLYLFLEKNGYKDKSQIEPTKILSKIPNDLKKYFWKGFIDGDGYISIKKYTQPKRFITQCVFELSGTIEYSWKEIKKVFRLLNVKKYKIRTLSTSRGNCSKVKVYGKEIIKLESIFIDFGLNRKSKQFSLIKQYFNRNKKNEN